MNLQLQKLFLIGVSLLTSLMAFGQTQIVPTECTTETFTVSEGDLFYDTGGPTAPGVTCTGGSGDVADGYYPNSGCETPTTLEGAFEVDILFMQIFGDFDWLEIHDGTTTSDPSILDSRDLPAGTQVVAAIIATFGSTVFTGTSGSLTFNFRSSTVVNRCGFEIEVTSAAGGPPVTDCEIICPDNIIVDNDPGECGAFVDVPLPEVIGCQEFSAVFSEDFDACELPAGWTVEAENTNDPDTLISTCGGNLFSFECTAYPGDDGSGAEADGAFGNDCALVVDMNSSSLGQQSGGIASVTSPVVDLSSNEFAYIQFDWQLEDFGGFGALNVDVWDGSQWVNLITVTDEDAYGLEEQVDVTDYMNADFQVRFLCDNEGREAISLLWGFAINNFVVFADDPSLQSPVVNDYNGSENASDVYPVGTTTVTFFPENDPDNSCTFEVTVEDTEGPTFTNCNDVTINLDAGECDQIVNFSPEVFDNCDGGGAAVGLMGDLTTTFAGGNGFAGNMFDITNLTNETIILDSFLVHVDGGGQNADIEFYSTPGTYVGNETNAGAWDLFVETTVVSNGAGTPTPVPFGGLEIEPGESFGIYFNLANYSLFGVGVDYTNGTNTYTDGNVEIFAGVGRGNPAFTGSTFQSRQWNGTVFYSSACSGSEIVQTSGPESGSTFEIGSTTVEFEATDCNGNVSTCSYDIIVNEFSNPSPSLACNDQVFVSVDENCEAVINADMILEGGLYGCYRDYIVQLATDMQFNNIIAESQSGDDGVIVGGAQVGNTYFVRVIDPETGNSCWGEVTIEDKLIPALECGTYAAACEASTDPDATITVEPAFLTASEDTMEIEQFQAIACPGGDYSYLRVIDLAAQGITGEFTPQLFRMGVETSTGGVDATLRFYRFTDPSVYDPNADGFSLGDLEQLGADNNGTIPALDFEFWELPVADVTVPGGTQYLVWELEVPGGNFADFVMGSNTLGETSPTYLASEFCGNVDPLTLSSLGFDGNWVSMVFGEAGGGIPFPLPEGTTVTPTTGEGPFVVSGFDPCGDVTLSFEDNVVDYPECTGDFVSTIFRDWTAIDESGNVSTCQDTINVTRSTLNDVVLPPNYDGIDEDALACDGDNWDENENGFPDPDETGVPNSMLCENILGTFDDHVIDVCEGTFKVLRNWTFVDWCTGETIDHLQVIKVEDVEGPEIECPATATISTATNSCIATYSVPDISGNITDECSPSSSFWTVESSAGEVIDFGNQVFQIIDLPVGTHTLTYTADDGCGNLATCEQTLIVQDAVPPVAVCDQNTKVTLGADGTARVFWPTFEDGSYDNCEIDRIEVRRMNREFDCEPTTFFFKEFVEFCCADIERSPVQVLFRVTDVSGNQNTCMVNVNVEDKLPPSIVAPQDLTISCLYPFDEWNLDEFGRVANLTEGEVRETRQIFDEEYERNCLNNNQYDPAIPTYEFLDGFAQDNCTLEVTADYNDQREDCGTGVIVRTFRAVDDFGNASTAFQRITVSQCSPFSESDIRWPRDRELSCNENGDYSTDPDATGEPEISNNNACSQIAVRKDDELFEVVPDACFKILRTWTVLDWCQKDAEGNNLTWTHTQVIKVNDDQAPELLVCDDVTFCDSAAVGCTGFAELVQEVEDCTPEEFLNISWRVKPFNAGNNPNDDIVGTGLDASGNYPFGTHRITWIIEDMCGNVGTCQYLFTVEDCKQPTPIVINGLATVVMPSSGCIEVDVDLFEAGSFDNCGPVVLSYSSDTTDTTRQFCCEDIEAGESQEVEFWVTDQAGNQDFVRTYILIQDPNEVCPDSDSLSIVSGTTARSASHGADAVSGVSMKFDDMSNPTPLFSETDGNGDFRFTGAQGHSYELSASKNDDVLNGVNTMDILLIQQHILGLNSISNPYDLIAANVNSDGRISGADLIELRKVILGIETNFPNNDSWRFVDAAEQLEAGQLPVNYSERITLSNVPATVADQDFVSVKIGDVNGTAIPNNLVGQEAEGRSGALVLNAQDAAVESGETIEVAVTSDMFTDVLGYQLTLNLNGLSVTGVDAGALDITEANYGVFAGQMTMSWNAVEAVKVASDEVLFTVTLKANQDVRLSEAVQVTSEITATEAYVSNEVRTVDLRFVDGTVKEFALYQNVPNPFESKTMIQFDLPEAGNATLTVFDQTGKVVKEIVGEYAAGSNQVELRRSDINGSGMLYYRLESGDYSAAKKMVIID